MREPDHSDDEQEALRLYLRPMRPDPVKAIADDQRRAARERRSGHKDAGVESVSTPAEATR